MKVKLECELVLHSAKVSFVENKSQAKNGKKER